MSQSAIGRFAVRHCLSIIFLVLAICLAGGYAAEHMGSAVFPQTNFPRVIVMASNGMMPADQMMATITRPIEEVLKEIPGCQTIKSSTGRGSAEIDIFFNWKVDMVQSELYVQGRLSQIRDELPTGTDTSVYRMTFSAFPIIGISLTSPNRNTTNLWEMARYTIKPQMLRVPGVARIDLVGGRPPEYHVIVDPQRLASLHLGINQVTDALNKTNLVVPTGVIQQDHTMYLTVVDGRMHSIADIENLTIPNSAGQPVAVSDFAKVVRGSEPAFSVVTAEGVNAVLLNVFSQPDASTLDIANQLKERLKTIRAQLPPDMKLAFFYDQSLLVRASVASVWEAILFGLVLSVGILYLFLRNWGTTLVATVVIPVTVLFTILAMKLAGMTFNLMTLGGIAAAIGLIIDDAIVVVEAIYAKMAAGLGRVEAVQAGISEIFDPLLGSTLTPVVVFIPLAFLDGIWGVFFWALAVTMVVALLTSLLLALTLTPSLAAWIVRVPADRVDGNSIDPHRVEEGGFILRRVIRLYEITLRVALGLRWLTVGLCVLVLIASGVLFQRLGASFLPSIDEGGFIIDYIAPPGASVAESNRQMLLAEGILKTIPEVESYSRRLGQQLGVALTEPNTGDFLVKLKPDRQRTSDLVIADVRKKFAAALPDIHWEYPGILTDLIGDLTWSDQPIVVKIFSTDQKFLTETAPRIERSLSKIPGVVDTNDGVISTGPSIDLRVRTTDAQRYGLTAADIAAAVHTAMLGQTASSVLEADRVVNIRVNADPAQTDRIATLSDLPLRAADGSIVTLHQVADIVQTPGQLELERDDLRQDIEVTAQLQGRDLGSAMADVQKQLKEDIPLPPGSVEFGGLYEQQQQSARQLSVVLGMAIVLVFFVAMIEFRSITGPVAIVFGAVLSIFGIILALLMTHTTLSIVAYLGAIIGMGIVHKNGILMLDYVEQLRAAGLDLHEALIRSGRRRLRPVLMTSMAAALGMLPLAYGIGSGADMLRPLAIAVIGAVCISVLLSLIATPTAYYLLQQLRLKRFAENPRVK